MIKGLKALEELRFQVGNITYHTHDLQITTIKVRDSGLFETIEKELKEYERLKEDIKKCSCWKEHKVLEIIRNKRVNVYNLSKYKTYNDYKLEWEINSNVFRETGNYNSFEISIHLLTQEEFDLLKEVLL